MDKYFISGIQQVGVGIPELQKAWKWFRINFGMDVKIFEDAGSAELMLRYTGNKPQKRHAVLAVNMQGGGGMEIWQYTERVSQPCPFEIQVGDLGINICKIKSPDIAKAFENLKNLGCKMLSEIVKNPSDEDTFFVQDPYNNIFQIVGSQVWFSQTKKNTGGTGGCIIGVKDIDHALNLYSGILGYDEVVYDKSGIFGDLQTLPGGKEEFRRVLLREKENRKGPFVNLFGKSEIELVQVNNRKAKDIFEGRQWGDMGFIHLCFDICHMNDLKDVCEKAGFPFTIDTGEVFQMGSAAGRFAYCEDGSGTLIEFVETYKVPILKKFGFYLDLTKRNREKPLANWMLKALGMNKVKD